MFLPPSAQSLSLSLSAKKNNITPPSNILILVVCVFICVCVCLCVQIHWQEKPKKVRCWLFFFFCEPADRLSSGLIRDSTVLTWLQSNTENTYHLRNRPTQDGRENRNGERKKCLKALWSVLTNVCIFTLVEWEMACICVYVCVCGGDVWAFTLVWKEPMRGERLSGKR